MKGIISSFRRGFKTQTMNQMIIIVDGITSKEEAVKLVGKEVVWKSPAGKIILGKVSSAHGNKGVVRAIFEKGLPGQAITTPVEIK